MTNKEIPSAVEFEIINIEPINDYISECEIKVFYHGRNRNGSYISKAVGNQIANSLPRAPIVALYNEQIDDYEDHGEEITINRDGIKFEKKTIPYGAVDKDTPAVWKKFWDNKGIEREYLVVRGFLWTGRYPHLKQILEKPKGQSMEFFEESVDGNWAKFDNETDEIFIFNEASVSALCILGDDVEPCFEDATIGKPEILYSLKKDEFKEEFDTFMFELNKILDHENNAEGGMAVKIENEEVKVEETESNDVEETEFVNNEEIESVEEEELETEFEESEEDAIETIEEEEVLATEEVEEEFTEKVEEDTRLEDLQKEYDLVNEELTKLKAEFAILMEEKNSRELLEKEDICNNFSILGEEVLKDFKENLSNYTAEELEKELSVVAFKKGISFNLLNEKDAIVTSAPVKNTEDVPAWVKAIKNKESEEY